jgi:8-oxo-dGTP diphosphatase
VDFYADGTSEQMHLYTADGFEGTLKECDEGDLQWVKREFLYSLPMWEGDKIFLDLLWQDAPFFNLSLHYEKDRLLKAVLDGNIIKNSTE